MFCKLFILAMKFTIQPQKVPQCDSERFGEKAKSPLSKVSCSGFLSHLLKGREEIKHLDRVYVNLTLYHSCALSELVISWNNSHRHNNMLCQNKSTQCRIILILCRLPNVHVYFGIKQGKGEIFSKKILEECKEVFNSTHNPPLQA